MQQQITKHKHEWRETETHKVCSCGATKLLTNQTNDEGRLQGIRKDGKIYSVREHRMSWIKPDEWVKIIKTLPTSKSKITAQLLIQTGARINEIRFIEERDIDYERNTLRLRVTKTKAKLGEKKGKPRNPPMNSKFIKELKKYFRENNEIRIKTLSTSAFNTALKKALKKINHLEWYMFSAHSIRKTHGNWLKCMGNLRLMNVDSDEICLRLGHDRNTYLKDYGSSSVLSNSDVMLVKQILGDLYQR